MSFVFMSRILEFRISFLANQEVKWGPFTHFMNISTLGNAAPDLCCMHQAHSQGQYAKYAQFLPFYTKI